MGIPRWEALRFKAYVHLLSSVAALATMGGAGQVYAFQVGGEDSDVSVRWDNTLTYSAMYRLKDPSSKLTNTPDPSVSGNIAWLNFDDGDRNLKKGIVSNRFDLLSELDVNYKGLTGFRFSGAAWYDSVYNSSNDNDSPDTVNSASVPAGKFTNGTRDMMGRKAELLDAFVFANGELGGMPVSGRLGKHTLIYGETIFFGSNGIAGGQAPVDAIKLLSVPGSQFKEILRPVQQVSGQVQVTSSITAGGYYQFEWEETRIPASGSYFSDFDPLGAGGEQGFLYTGAPDFLGGPVSTITNDGSIDAKNSGQGGVQLRLRPQTMDTEFGLYAIQYHDKTPQFYVYPNDYGVPATYKLVYPENIRAFGSSFSTVLGSASVAGEFSYRNNTPLVSRLSIVGLDEVASADNNNDPLYAVGDSLHFNLSMIQTLSPRMLWDGGTIMGEMGWNRRISISKNPDSLDPNVTRDALGFRVLFSPEYYQVMPGIDISVPLMLGYNPKGKSSVVQSFNGGVNHGGDMSIGIDADYQKQWKFSLKYAHYLGKENVKIIPSTSENSALMSSFDQTLKDRDFVSFSIQRTF